MAEVEVIDIFLDFLQWWAKAHERPVDEQINGWADEYLSSLPELLKKQTGDYAEQSLDWRKVAAERIFPFLDDRLSAMREAHKYLLEACLSIYSKARQTLNFDVDIVFVIHVGIGCGAGWATNFRGKPAILFGLENIAECGWSDAAAIRGLIAHELGHIIHAHWRTQNKKLPGEGAWWQLYEEGFAQRCETLINEPNVCHQAAADVNWLE